MSHRSASRPLGRFAGSRATYSVPVPATRKPAVGQVPTAAEKRRAAAVLKALASAYPDARCELDFTTPLQLLVATVLSAQCTDQRVNAVTPALFAKYPDAAAYAAADRAELEALIAPTGFFRQKSATLQSIGAALCERFDGKVPASLEELVTLPGVGRKTANVVLGNAFDVPGITVDTHLGRIARRLGWSKEEDPVKVEADLALLVPKREWTMMSHRVIWLGRRCCHARRPACGACAVARWCPSFGEGPTDPVQAAKLLRTKGRG